MSDNSKNTKEQENNKSKPALTPHEFFNHHLQNPNEPITDEDIRSLKLDSGAVSREHHVHESTIIPPAAKKDGVKKETEDEEKEDNGHQKNMESPYDILGG